MELGKLEEVTNLRTVWPHEALDFTPWLAKDENLQLLSEAIGLEIEVEEVESSVGGFHADIFAKEIGSGKNIIIENQLEQTNHDHLGKLITYAAGKGAGYLIWIVKDAREEHKAAVEWLNEHTDDGTGVFLLEIKLYKIGDSLLAPKFEVLEQPNEWTKVSRKSSIENNEWQEFNLTYWEDFLSFANSISEYSAYFKKRKCPKDNYIDVHIGIPKAHLVYSINKQNNQITVCLYTHRDELYDSLLHKKPEIEEQLGHLVWDHKEGRKASKISKIASFNITDKSNWKEQFQWIIDTALSMRQVFTALA